MVSYSVLGVRHDDRNLEIPLHGFAKPYVGLVQAYFLKVCRLLLGGSSLPCLRPVPSLPVSWFAGWSEPHERVEDYTCRA